MTVLKMCLFTISMFMGAWIYGCKNNPGFSSDTAGLEGMSIKTTYYPAKGDVSMGPGHFSCSELNGVNQWYVAPSDTFGDDRVWQGPPCPAAPGKGYADCSPVQKTCGVKIQLTCTSKCRANAPAVVVMITDYCPKNHPTNKANGNCQGGPHFDIGKPVWDIMQGANDNITVSYQVVSSSTALGPVSGSSTGQSTSQSTSQSSSSGSGGDNSGSSSGSITPINPLCTTNGGQGYGQQWACGNSMCAENNSDYTSYCIVNSTSGQQTGTSGGGTTSSGSADPKCTANGGQGYGTQYTCGSNTCAKNNADFTGQCIVGPYNNGVTTMCTSNGGQGYGQQWACGSNTCAENNPDYTGYCIVNNSGQQQTSGSNNGGSSSWNCTANGGQGYGTQYTCGSNTCAKNNPDYTGECIIGNANQQQTSSSSSSSSGGSDYPSCSGNQYCNGGWGWLNSGENGCNSGSAGWKGNGCSCRC